MKRQMTSMRLFSFLILLYPSLNHAFNPTTIHICRVPLPQNLYRKRALTHNPRFFSSPSFQEKEEAEGSATESPYITGRGFAISETKNRIDFFKRRLYDWKEFWPNSGGLAQKLRWIVTGEAFHKIDLSDDDLRKDWGSLARLLILLREYESRYGMPDFGGPDSQQKIISDIVTALYGAGTPTWVLEAVVSRMEEGLTGKEGLQLMLLPNRAFISYYPSEEASVPSTELVKLTPGFDIARLGALESVVVRVASFASNTKSSERVSFANLRLPHKQELLSAQKRELKVVANALSMAQPEEEDLAEEILNLAADSYGLFYFLSSPQMQEAVNATSFWKLTNSTTKIFSRLAAREASTKLETIRKEEKSLYSKTQVACFRFLSSAGACAMWFRGSFFDMLAAGSLALLVNYMVTKQVLAFEERVLTEVFSSCFVGMVAGLLAIRFPNTFCFPAIALAAVLDFMQGFKVVFAVIEVLTRNQVTGTARFLEGILFTGLISYSIKCGLHFASWLLSGSSNSILDAAKVLIPSHNPISPWWFLILLPLATTGWSGLFRPSRTDLPVMALHGMMAMFLSWAGMSPFVSAMCVTFSAGVISRFTGRQALANSFSGLYALTPGTYMARALLDTSKIGFLEHVLVASVTIGLGAWTGTILCSPTILGKTSFNEGKGNTQKSSMLRF